MSRLAPIPHALFLSEGGQRFGQDMRAGADCTPRESSLRRSCGMEDWSNSQDELGVVRRCETLGNAQIEPASPLLPRTGTGNTEDHRVDRDLLQTAMETDALRLAICCSLHAAIPGKLVDPAAAGT